MRFDWQLTCWFVATLCTLSGGTPVVADEPTAPTLRNVYLVGHLDEGRATQVALTIQGHTVRGQRTAESTGQVLSIAGQIAGRLGAEGSLTWNEADERGRIRGRVEAKFTGLPARIEGTWISVSGALKLPVRFTQVAETVDMEFRHGDQAIARCRFPRLLKPFRPDPDPLQPHHQAAIEEMSRFLNENVEEQDPDGNRYRFVFEQRVEGDLCWVSAELISLRVSTWAFTGGAHGNTWYSSINVRLGEEGPIELKLSDLFQPDSDAVDIVSRLCVEDLKQQHAEWILSGVVSSFEVDELVFTLSPAGLQLTFAPYTTGPFVAGSRSVTIPWDRFESSLSPGPWKNWATEHQRQKRVARNGSSPM